MHISHVNQTTPWRAAAAAATPRRTTGWESPDQGSQVFTGPVPVCNWRTFDSHRGRVASREVTAVQQTQDDTQEVGGAALREGAEAGLAGSRAADMQMSSLKVAVVELDVTPCRLEQREEKVKQIESV